eukprot:TRINITY_DN57226_c0_g1_i1.p1 TRINITY_DN57226_c0_g1~~TRINITY_DN57226_c0_g1_i1.p1  ORF type:complete len:567 (-),score=67.03 TRINITY_DN57226_c0_g1_i1:95-1795(-)
MTFVSAAKAPPPLVALPRVPRATVVPRHPHGDSVRKHYKVVEEIGRGAFSRVILVRERATQQERACKVVSSANVTSEISEMLKKEIHLLCSLDHPHIVKIFEYAEDSGRQELVLILEYLPGGDCLTLLREFGFNLTEQVVARFIRHVLLALSYCHAQAVIHRDVKPEHMMLTGIDSAWQRADCKLIDFGLASRFDRSLPKLLGTPSYLAPEVVGLRRELFTYTPKCDVWAVGVSAVELIAGACPFGKPADHGGDPIAVFERITRYKHLDGLAEESLGCAPSWRGRSNDAYDFLRFVLCADESSRPDAAAVLGHCWLHKHRDILAGVTPEMLRGLSCFSRVPLLARYCLYIVAARLSVPDAESFGEAFLSLDVDADGRLSRQELFSALCPAAREASPSSSWWRGGDTRSGGQAIDVDELLQAANMDRTGYLSFTEFVAASLAARHNSLEDLVTCAFDALDVDRDGFVDLDAIRSVFCHCDFPLPHRLPQDRPFDLHEWVWSITGRQPPQSGRPTRPRAVRAPGFFDRLFDHFNCTPCTSARRVEYIIPSSERVGPATQPGALEAQAG